MLRELKIDNYAIIGHLDIAFHPGLNIITGETGAGKSILLGALSLLGGSRADASTIRDGAASCTVEAVFDVRGYRDELLPIFEENDLDWADEITVRRTVSATGKSRAFIDDIPVNLGTLRAVAEKLLRRFGIDIYALRTEPLESDLFAEGLSLSLGGRELLQIGVVSPRLCRRFDLKQEVYFMEMNFDVLVHSTEKHRIAVQELSKFPEVRRDLALLVDRSVTFAALRDVAFAAERKLLRSVTLFDVYEGDKLPEGKKSYALGFVLEDRERTLDEKTIEKVMSNLTRQFEHRCGARVRG